MKGPRSHNGGKGIMKAHKEKLRAEAIERQAKRDKRSDAEQLKELSYRPGLAAKETARLRARIDKAAAKE